MCAFPRVQMGIEWKSGVCVCVRACARTHLDVKFTCKECFCLSVSVYVYMYVCVCVCALCVLCVFTDVCVQWVVYD